MKIVLVTAEADPFIRTGGLGEVLGSLPAFLHKQGIDVRVIMPKYSNIPKHLQREFNKIANFNVQVSWRKQYCGLEETSYQGVHYYFIDNEYYFSRSRMYGEHDDAERFAFFSRAALESLIHIPGFKPDIIHCNDWHTALIPLMLSVFYSREPLYYLIKTLFTIHNLKYQGIFPKEVLGDILGLGMEYFTEHELEFYDALNYMKAALLYADRITTVSPTHAQEIQTPFYGEKLDGIIRKRTESVSGILNGIDYTEYNPLKDPYLMTVHNNVIGAKKDFKEILQRSMELPVCEDRAILGMVSQLTDQKGVDLLAHVIEEILQLDLQIIVLGTGERQYEELFTYLAFKYPDKLAIRLTTSDRLAHQIYAGSDMLMIPSRIEPCGMAQMIAMRYGTVPIVRETGGLKDTVIPYNEMTAEGNGFSFIHYNAHEFLSRVEYALKIYQADQSVWGKIRQNALESDFSWGKSSNAYIEIYKSMLKL